MKVFSLVISLIKVFSKEKSVLVALIIFPLILIGSAAASAPEGVLPLSIEGVQVYPPVEAETLLVLLYSLTSIVFVASISSFFLFYQLKAVLPRLRISGYSNYDIVIGFTFVTFAINLAAVVLISNFSLVWVNVRDYFGYSVGLFLGAVIFSIIGLLTAKIVDSKTLGLNSILTLSILDTAFLENPVFSRRYDAWWIDVMPSHRSLSIILKSSFELGSKWTSDLSFVSFYFLILVMIYIIAMNTNVGFGAK
jgi:hypothetical protein